MENVWHLCLLTPPLDISRFRPFSELPFGNAAWVIWIGRSHQHHPHRTASSVQLLCGFYKLAHTFLPQHSRRQHDNELAIRLGARHKLFRVYAKSRYYNGFLRSCNFRLHEQFPVIFILEDDSAVCSSEAQA
jgi:hypothetical protein